MKVEQKNENPSTSLSKEVIKNLKQNEPYGFDLDGVFVDLASLPLATFNLENGTNFSLDEIRDPYIMDDWYMQLYNCTKEVANAYTTALWNRQDFLENAPVAKGALELLDLFNSLKIEYRFITSRPFSTFAYTQNWFQNVGLGSHFERVLIQTTDSYNRRHKVDTIRNWGIKVHFEDMPAHALDIIQNTESLVVVVSHPWNRQMDPHPRIIRPHGEEKEADLMHAFSQYLKHLEDGRTS